MEGVRGREKLLMGHSAEWKPTLGRKECPEPLRPQWRLESMVLHRQEFSRCLLTLGVGKGTSKWNDPDWV